MNRNLIRTLTVAAVVGAATVLVAPAPAMALNFEGSLAEGRHERYVSPMTNPVYNESPYITTEARLFHMYQSIPKDFVTAIADDGSVSVPVTNGGDIHLVALQLRFALTDRLAIIATKDGYAVVDFDKGDTEEDGDVYLVDDRGFANLAAGLKFALLDDPSTDTIVSLGVRYEAPSGGHTTHVQVDGTNVVDISTQGQGDGFIDTFVTGATVVNGFGLQGSIGVNAALDGGRNSSMLHYSAHADYEVLPGLFPLIEVNGFTTFNDGNELNDDLKDLRPLFPGGVDGVEGVDLVNFGMYDTGTVVTIGGGFRYLIGDHVAIGVAGEGAVTDREDMLEWRITSDLIVHL